MVSPSAQPVDDAPSNVVPLPRPTSLLEALRRGEATAVAELFDRHATTVERAAQAVLGLDPEVEDLVQDAFVAALRGIDGFRGDDRTLGPWVRGIVVRLALKKLRWRRARRWLGWPSTEEALLEVPGLTDTETQAALRRAHALLQRLPPVERAAFGMRFIEGMRLEEVAESLGISLATTKRRLERARRRFGRLAGRDALLCNWRGRERDR